jgi:hypothetical protein
MDGHLENIVPNLANGGIHDHEHINLIASDAHKSSESDYFSH